MTGGSLNFSVSLYQRATSGPLKVAVNSLDAIALSIGKNDRVNFLVSVVLSGRAIGPSVFRPARLGSMNIALGKKFHAV